MPRDRQYAAAELVGIHDTLKRLAATAAQNPAPMSSVEIEQLAKPGCPPKVTIKCYSADLDEAAAHATALYDQLTARYAVPAAA